MKATKNEVGGRRLKPLRLAENKELINNNKVNKGRKRVFCSGRFFLLSGRGGFALVLFRRGR